MGEPFSGEMLVGLMRLVGKIVSSPGSSFQNMGAEEAELERLRVLLCSGEDTALKAAMANLIERLKSEHPDPAAVESAMKEVQRLWPDMARLRA